MNSKDMPPDDNQEEPLSMSRREAFKTMGTAAAAAAMGMGSAAQAAEQKAGAAQSAEPGATPP